MAEAGPLGLYVHIPFCSGKCAYCDFTSFPGRGGDIPRYLAALEAEAGLVRSSRSPETLYVGGGTPSELDASRIEELFARLRRAYPEARFSEATFECNPESVDEAKLRALRRAGVTRLSIGFQSLDAGVLRAAGRRHTPERSLRAFRLARAAGDWSVSVDLICGLPGQGADVFREDLDRVLALEPDHLSLYGFDAHENTPLARSGFVPDEDLGRAMLEAALARTAAAGLVHYEISNFSKPGHQSWHNLNCWNGGEYIGLGCAASSHLGGERSRSTGDLDAYLREVGSGRRPVAESERLEGKEKLGERVFLGLRRVAGLELEPEMQAQFGAEWQDLERRGLVTRHGGRARLTREGLFLANDAFASFVAPFERGEHPLSVGGGPLPAEENL
ncbi:MAG: radical SAM family heme chaperone HemW [Elusimicrobia bacterium]|nr:radical SAM family heme chaperone HemW [Elusimicrobiota bacterium]